MKGIKQKGGLKFQSTVNGVLKGKLKTDNDPTN